MAPELCLAYLVKLGGDWALFGARQCLEIICALKLAEWVASVSCCEETLLAAEAYGLDSPPRVRGQRSKFAF